MGKKILIVEDTAMDADISKDILLAEGFDVEIATSGAEGIEKALAIQPDLILLDLVLPDIMGFEVCKRIKSERTLENAIVIILSIKDNLEDITRAFHSGADDYLIKRPLPEFLVKKIRLYLGIGR